jgi:hypothetical protein
MVTKDEHLVRVGLPVGAMDEARTRVYELHEKLQRRIKITRSYVVAAVVVVVLLLLLSLLLLSLLLLLLLLSLLL